MSEEKVCECHNHECCDNLEHECNCIKEDKEEHKEKKCKKDKHLDKLNEAYNKISELEESLLRSKADFINYRKRLEEEQTRLFKYCNEDMVMEILPVIDSLERAINMDDKNLEDEVSKFLSGFKMIYCNLISVLNKYGVKAIDGNNKPFDPAFHQAVMTEASEMESGMVIEVLQKGYLLKDKVIRPAMVKVSE